MWMLFFLLKQCVRRNLEDFGKCDDFNIGYEPFSAFNALNGVFVDIKTDQLKPVCKGALGDVQLHAKTCDIFAAHIVSSILGLVNEHVYAPL